MPTELRLRTYAALPSSKLTMSACSPLRHAASTHAADSVVFAVPGAPVIKTMVGISCRVDVGLPDSIERTLVGKARRVVDKRPK